MLDMVQSFAQCDSVSLGTGSRIYNIQTEIVYLKYYNSIRLYKLYIFRMPVCM